MTVKSDYQIIVETCLELIRQEDETIETVLARHPEQAAQIRPLLEAALWLTQKQGAIRPRPGFVAASKQRLTTRIRSEHVRSQHIRSERRWDRTPYWVAARQALRQPLMRIAVLLLLVGSVILNGYQAVKATQTSLPGDLVYSLKIAQENLQLAMTLDRAGAARLHTRFAQFRLLEVQALVLEGRYEQIPATVAGFEKHVSAAIRALASVAPHDRDQAGLLAQDLQTALTSQTGLVTILSSMAPQATRRQFDRVRLISELGLIQVQDLLLPGSWQPGAPGPFGAQAG